MANLREIAKQMGYTEEQYPNLFMAIKRIEEQEAYRQEQLEGWRRAYQMCQSSGGHRYGPPAADGRDMGARCQKCGAPEE